MRLTRVGWREKERGRWGGRLFSTGSTFLSLFHCSHCVLPPPPVPPHIRQLQNANLVVRRRVAELEALMAQVEATVATLTKELELVRGGGRMGGRGGGGWERIKREGRGAGSGR